MFRLQTPLSTISLALKRRSEGMGIRASGSVLSKAHANISRWEKRLATQVTAGSPPAPDNSALTLEGDELYTRVGEHLPPPQSLYPLHKSRQNGCRV